MKHKTYSQLNRTISFKGTAEQKFIPSITRFIRNSQKSVFDPTNAKKLSVRPTLHAIEKAVKNNSLVPLLGDHKRKIKTQPVEQDLIAEQTEQQLLMFRKKYDQIRNKRKQQDERIKGLKTQISRYKGKSLDLTQISKPIPRESIDQKISQSHLKMQEKVMEKKTYIHLKNRMKEDLTHYRTKLNESTKTLKQLQKKIKSLRRERNEHVSMSFKAEEVYKRFATEINEENIERAEHLTNMEYLIEKKLSALHEDEFRTTKIQAIATETQQQKLEQQIKWKDTHLTHLFVSRMLQDKINIEMDKFKVVENAFITIKHKTGISTAKELIDKFLNKETIYSSLVSKVNEKNIEIEELKEEREKLINQLSLLTTDIPESHKKQPLTDHQKVINLWNERASSVKLTAITLKEWLRKQFLKLGQKMSDEIPIKENLLNFIKLLHRNLNQIGTVKQEYLLYPLNGEKKLRTETRSRKGSLDEKHVRQEYSRNTYMAASYEQINNREETEALALQREEILKKNEKFMKEVKKRKTLRKREGLDFQKKDKK